jgi:aspartate carbamoyltransferase catalytic subunit
MAGSTWDRHDLLGLYGLSAPDLLSLLDQADEFRHGLDSKGNGEHPLSGCIVANLFFEDSTRTRMSFTVAARRLGADVIDLAGAGSSVSKGESLIDTALTIEAMGVDVLVVRSSAAGAADLIAGVVSCSVINAGDGRHEHPTQGLLDALTVRQRLKSLEGRQLAIVGDIAGSRVARSATHAFTTLGADVHLIGPPTLVPTSFTQIAAGPGRVFVGHDLDQALGDLDGIMMLRVQFERGTKIAPDYRQHYALTSERAACLPEGAIVIHPGPMNRGVELDSEVADGSRSVIRDQVTNGVAVRMAVLSTLLNAPALA